MTPKCTDAVPPAGTVIGPQVSVCPETVGSAVVAPVVVPDRYEKPVGSTSESPLRVTAPMLLFVTVMV